MASGLRLPPLSMACTRTSPDAMSRSDVAV
ncbi:Uncharacterised protein [Bordetella pertussis]|nr:Uncharacterised protein [Bordetella pertussis]CFP61700.1 Uncharacterised protein [Bordetella pertussis]CFW41178.1 Uncharacterised protein [Bordetella pertussis]